MGEQRDGQYVQSNDSRDSKAIQTSPDSKQKQPAPIPLPLQATDPQHPLTPATIPYTVLEQVLNHQQNPNRHQKVQVVIGLVGEDAGVDEEEAALEEGLGGAAAGQYLDADAQDCENRNAV
jgi:hypothetical protein